MTRAGAATFSVVIPLLDGGPAFAHLCRHLSQLRNRFDLDVLIVDSGSRDGSPDCARDAGFRLHRIARGGASPGRIRNFGASLARGDVVGFLTQDVLPCTPDWPARFAAALADPVVAGVYGRQIPRNAAAREMLLAALHFPPEPQRYHARSLGMLMLLGRLPFSSAFSAVRRDVWAKVPFVEDVPVSEDQVWAHQVLAAGYCIEYEPAAEALQAQPCTFRGMLCRTFRLGQALRTRGLDRGAAFAEAHRSLVQQLRYVVRQGPGRGLAQLLPYELAHWAALHAGRLTPWIR